MNLSTLNIRNILPSATCKNFTFTEDTLTFSLDSRTIQKNHVFLAIPPYPNRHGGLFIPDAEKKGGIILYDNTSPITPQPNTPSIHVPCILDAITTLAQHILKNLTSKKIFITGSSGKTTVKNMLLHTIPQSSYGPQGNQNCLIGIILTVLNMPQANVHVFEIGISKNNEMSAILNLFPKNYADVAVITSIAPTHVEGIGHIETIITEKTKIFSLLKPNGLVVIEDDQKYTKALEHAATNHTIYYFGSTPHATVRLIHTTMDHKTLLFNYKAAIGQSTFEGQLNCIGEHMARNAACCLAAILALQKQTDILSALFNLASFMPTQRRGNFLAYKDGFILDYTYNAANTRAICANIDAFMQFPHKHKIIVLTDLKEQGIYTEQSHENIAIYLSKQPYYKLYTYGPYLAKACQTLKNHFSAKSRNEIQHYLLNEDQKDAIILVQGSRSAMFEVLVDSLVTKALND